MVQAQQAMDSQAHMGFQIPAELYRDIQALIDRIRQQPRDRHLAREAADMVSDLLHRGIRAFYFDIVEDVHTHPGTRRSADAGITTVTKGADLVIRKMANNLEPDELLVFANYLNSLLLVQSDECYLAFPLDTESQGKLQKVIDRIRSDANTHTYNHLIVEALCQLADQAVQHFYYRPTKLIKIRAFVKKSADLGIRTVQKGIHFVIRLMFRKTRQRELIRFSTILENQLVYLPASR